MNRSDKATVNIIDPMTLLIERTSKLGGVRAAPRRRVMIGQYRRHLDTTVGPEDLPYFVQPQPQRPITMKPPLLVDAPRRTQTQII